MSLETYLAGRGLGSDHIAFTRYGFPSTMGAEGNPATGGPALGEFCPYIHSANDTMNLDDEFGYFSVEVSLVIQRERAVWVVGG